MDSTSPSHDTDWSSLPVRERVLQRLHRAQLAPDDRTRETSAPKRERRAAPEGKRESQALRRVFLDLGDCYRDYRRRTGVPVASEIRDAAYAFRRNRDLDSLVTVAASLDRQASLRW
jgi:hypothetical protein